MSDYFEFSRMVMPEYCFVSYKTRHDPIEDTSVGYIQTTM